MATTKATKQVHWIARYSHKTNGKLNGIVTYAVRSSDNESVYCTTFIEGKASGCSCKSRNGRCYHRTQLAVLEASRKPVVTEQVAEMVAIEEPTVVVMPTQTVVEAPVVVKPVWNNWAARWDDPRTGKPTATLGGVPYWNEDKGFLAHPEGKVWNEWMEEWVSPVKPDMMNAALTSNKAFSIMR